MKAIITTLILTALLVSCKQNTHSPEVAPTPAPVVKKYPSAMDAIFKAHGGIDTWNTMNNLCFTIEKKEGNETHKVDLKSRKARIETSKFTLGFDGEKVWLDQDSTYFAPQKARFYHNLMFYFYAMPYVLGDEGINYEPAKSIEFNGVTYPGTKVSFESGIGDSPKDEYLIYSDPKTNEMAWLAYTVTFFNKQEKGSEFSYIKYDQWVETNGLKLPTKLQWYKFENGSPTEMVNEYTFIKPSVTKTVLEPSIFMKPESGKFAE